MNKPLYIKLTGFYCILQLFSFSIANAQDHLPPILDYYPNCSYDKITTSKVRSRTEQPRNIHEYIRVLNKLQIQAQLAGADAIIVTNRKIRKVLKPLTGKVQTVGSNIGVSEGKNSSDVYHIIFEGEFIKNCHENGKVQQIAQRRVTPYNREGIALTEIADEGNERNEQPIKVEKFQYQFSTPNRTSLFHPKISEDEVSINNGVYGIALGSSLKQVRDVFGDPSAELMIQPGELFIGYGRRHWLQFRNNKLVRIQSTSPILSQNIVNKIPLREFFDDFPWKINDKVKHGAPLAGVKSALNIKDPLNSEFQLIINKNDSNLILQFSHSKNNGTGQETDILKGFSLQKSDFKSPPTNLPNQELLQYKVIEQAYSQLLSENELDWQELKVQLGQPIGKLTLTKRSELYVYNSHLLVGLGNSELTGLYFVEQALIQEHLEDDLSKPWNFGPFKQGYSIGQFSSVMPDNALESEDSIEIESDMYSLSLHFDELNGKTSLYQVDMKLF